MPAGKPKMVKFDSLAGVPCYYARVNAAYEDVAKAVKSRKRELVSGFLARLEACVAEIYWLTFGHLGPLQVITSGGAWVPISKRRPKSDWHTRGKAYDLGGLHWPARQLVLFRTAAARKRGEDWNWILYLSVEAIIRRHFGTVLGILYNAAHHNHWHIDPGTEVGFWSTGFGAGTRVTFLQAVLKDIWGLYEGKLDGDYGPKSKAAVAAVRAQLKLGPFEDQQAWSQFLLLTAMAGLQHG